MEKYLSSTGSFLAVLSSAILMPIFEFMYGPGEAVMYTMLAPLLNRRMQFFVSKDYLIFGNCSNSPDRKSLQITKA